MPVSFAAALSVILRSVLRNHGSTIPATTVTVQPLNGCGHFIKVQILTETIET